MDCFMPTAVLMSTYNGLRFLDAQIASIMAQFDMGDQLIIRDDGSTDGTADYLRNLSDRRLTVVFGNNIGAGPSFLQLTCATPENADMIMFADQDDIWLPHKIARARSVLGERIGSEGRPALYCSRTRLVDMALNEVGLSANCPRGPSFENALVENIAIGCTCAFNRAALRQITDYQNPGLIFFHDWWCYLIVSGFGEVLFDPEPTMLYRQHSANVVGMSSGLARYLTIFKFVRRHSLAQIIYDQNFEFLQCHGARLLPEKRQEIGQLFGKQNIKSALRLIVSTKWRRQSRAMEWIFRAYIAFDVAVRLKVWTTPR